MHIDDDDKDEDCWPEVVIRAVLATTDSDGLSLPALLVCWVELSSRAKLSSLLSIGIWTPLLSSSWPLPVKKSNNHLSFELFPCSPIEPSSVCEFNWRLRRLNELALSLPACRCWSCSCCCCCCCCFVRPTFSYLSLSVLQSLSRSSSSFLKPALSFCVAVLQYWCAATCLRKQFNWIQGWETRLVGLKR